MLGSLCTTMIAVFAVNWSTKAQNLEFFTSIDWNWDCTFLPTGHPRPKRAGDTRTTA